MANTITLNNSTLSVGVVPSALIPPNSPLDMGSLTTMFTNMTPLDTPPASPVEDNIYLDSGANTASGTLGFRRYTGSAWEDFGLQSVAEAISLADLDDVTISAIVDGERLVYNASSGEWENIGTIDGGSFSG